MEDHTPPTLSSEQVSARSSSALRELQQRAQEALAASRNQASRLEAEITQQFDDIAATLQQQSASDASEAAEIESSRAEIERLSSELESSRTAWGTERAALELERDELAAVAARLKPLTKELDTSWAAWAADKAALEIERVDLVEKVARLERVLADADKTCAGWLEEQTGLETERKELAEKIASLEARCEEADKSRDEWRTEKALLEAERGSLAEKVAQLEAAAGGSDTSHAMWTAERSILEAKREELSEKVAHLQRACDSLAGERDTWQAERAAIEAHRNELAETVSRLEAQQHVSQDEWRDQLLDFEGRLRQQQASWNDQRAEWTEARIALGRERDELQQKFELALEDVHRFRGRVAELEQELARRPEINQVDSAELVALRAERDALSERVEQLEQRPAAPIDTNIQQELADLQRRFELAVEDVREFKTKSAKLESQLAAAGSKSSVPADGGGMDWESQKRRLLALLEGDGDTRGDPVHEKERATIEGTIEMTDAVVAEKDREIAALRVQLAAGEEANPIAVDAECDRRINELVDADTVIAEHRQRIAEMERDLESTLRAAELELSVERAKMARQKVELDELRSELESQRQLYEPNGPPGAPRRRWRTKLGLGGDE